MVSTLQGTDSSFDFSYGNTYPAIALPFPMNAWSPYTRPATSFFYQYEDTQFRGIVQTHQPSPHMGDYGAFAIMPVGNAQAFAESDRASSFSHAEEVASPSYYKVNLKKWDAVMEVTPTSRAAAFRVTFNKGDVGHIVVDGLRGPTSLRVLPQQRKLTGVVTNNSGGVPENFGNHLVIIFDQPFTTHSLWSSGTKTFEGNEAHGDAAGVILSFPLSASHVITFSVASSFIDDAQAEVNLANEVGGAPFDDVHRRADKEWNKTLGSVRVEGGSLQQRQTFYSALYRSVLFPQKLHEPDSQGANRYFSPYDGKVHQGVMYTNSGFWDTFRAVHPLFNLLFPDVSADIVKGMLAVYDQSGFLPSWSSPGHRPIMIGNHAFSILADAFVKGVAGVDAKAAFAAVIHDAHTDPPKSMRTIGRQGATFYDALGYVPTPEVGEGVSKTLEYAYDDFCAAQIARMAGDGAAESAFEHTAQNYRNVYDGSTGFMRGRLRDGTWYEPFDPFDWGGRYTEGNAYHWNWSVFHDVKGLIDLMGGEEAFTEKLDAVFSLPPIVKVGAYKRLIHEMSEMISINMGQYAHANQPVQHAIYLYDYVGQPWKAQSRAREVMTKLYNPSPRGLCGDEDTGQTSAWFVFSALGFYPVTPGHPSYAVGSPLFTKATLNLRGGRRFVIAAPGNSADNVYINAAQLNGSRFDRTFLQHDELMAGGKLEFDMRRTPNKLWGRYGRPFSMHQQ